MVRSLTGVDLSTSTTTSSATPTPTGDARKNFLTVTAQAAAAAVAAPSGTPIDGNTLIIRLLDNGTARALTWATGSGGYQAIAALPTTTVAGKLLYVGFIFNGPAARWDCVSTQVQP